MTRISRLRRLVFVLAPFALVGTAPAPGPAGALRFVVTVAGRPAGTMLVEPREGTTRISYAYTDRGRGPDEISVQSVDDQLLIESLELAGSNYLKAPVRETVSRKASAVAWTSDVDKGERAAGGFYLPNEASPEHLAMLARALLKSPSGEVNILPSGTAKLSKADTGADAADLPAQLYFIEGIGFSSVPIWLDGKGRLVFQGDAWLAAVRDDSLQDSPRFVAAQDLALARRDEKIDAALRHETTTNLVIRHCRVFDARRKTMLPDRDVLIQGGRIAAVGRAGHVAIPAGATVVLGSGRTLLPGLWDNHVHIGSSADLLMHLAAGVTTVRDMGNDLESSVVRRDRVDRGELAGPRILLAGLIDSPGPLAGPTKALVADASQLRDWIDRFKDNNYVQVKLYSSLLPSLVPIAAQLTHARGMRLSGHVPAGMTMEEVVRAGYDEVQHANFWFLNFMGPAVNARTNGMTRYYAVARGAADFDLHSPQVVRFVSLLRRRGTVLDPTLAIFEGLFTAQRARPAPDLADIVDRLPPIPRRAAFGGGLATTTQELLVYSQSFRKMLAALKMMHDAGVAIIPGTDSLPGFDLHRELELYVASGIPARDVLQMATLTSAQVNRLSAQLGTIEAGKLADLVLVEGDPSRRISDIRRTVLVIRGGRAFDPAVLEAAVHVVPHGAGTR